MGGAHDSHGRLIRVIHDFFLDQKLLNKRRLLYAYLDRHLLSNESNNIDLRSTPAKGGGGGGGGGAGTTGYQVKGSVLYPTQTN